MSLEKATRRRNTVAPKKGKQENEKPSVIMCVKVTQSCPILCNPMDCIAYQALLSMEFSRKEYCNGLSFHLPGDLPDLGIKLASLISPALAGRFFTTSATWGHLGAFKMFNPCVRKVAWRRAWQPTPVFFPGEFHGQKNLVGYSPRGHKESDTTEQ